MIYTTRLREFVPSVFISLPISSTFLGSLMVHVAVVGVNGDGGSEARFVWVRSYVGTFYII